LSAYINLIDRRKIVAIRKNVEALKHVQVQIPGTNFPRLLTPSDVPNGVYTDPATGRHTLGPCQTPWLLVPYTITDVMVCLSLWEVLVEFTHKRSEPEVTDHEDEFGLATNEIISTLPAGFAKEFIAKALKPRFKYIAPGLRVQSHEELVDQPFRSSLRPAGYDIPPLLILRGNGKAAHMLEYRQQTVDPVPVGLYLEHRSKGDPHVYEDACRMFLPCDLGGNGSSVRTADRRPFSGPCDDLLYQIGYNAYVASHGTKLEDVLVLWTNCVTEGYWGVDENGVTGTIEKFREAETEEHCMRYIVTIDYTLDGNV
jgi:hypothetical protein